MSWRREIGLQKLRECCAEIERTASAHPMNPRLEPIFVRNADAWFLPIEAKHQRAYQSWILEQLPVTNAHHGRTKHD